mmetsp:Transcript_132937/g.244402  ORF Transcript_132937/g.244402 Transcript_132937/m.244402 type:complete len:233 (+) Transcript_132937:993-1691(+)
MTCSWVPEPPAHAGGRNGLVHVWHSVRSGMPTMSCKRSRLQGKWKKLLDHGATAAKILLQLMCRELISKHLGVANKEELLPLPFGHDSLELACDGAEQHWHVADVESEDSDDIMVAHDLVDVREGTDWQLRDAQAFEVNNDVVVLYPSRDKHVPQHVLHAEDQQLNHAINALQLVPFLRYPPGSNDDGWSQRTVSATEIDNAVFQIVPDLRVGDGTALKVIQPPSLSLQHEV